MNIKFKKFGLSQTDVQQMREYGILPDKKTLQNLIKAHHSNNPEPDEIAQLQEAGKLMKIIFNFYLNTMEEFHLKLE